jgi:hypothetical protein
MNDKSPKQKTSKNMKFKPDRHTLQLVLWTMIIGVLSFVTFWLVIAYGLLPDALLPKSLTQENTGLFEALGGWALGFAGALVAIKIAGLATNIQQNDSIRNLESFLTQQADIVSDYNSEIIRAIFDAKRACHAVLVFGKENEFVFRRPLRPSSRQKNSYLYNTDESDLDLRPRDKEQDLQIEKDRQIQQDLNNNLIEKFEGLISVLEKASRHSLFREVLSSAEQAQANGQKETAETDGLKIEYIKNKFDPRTSRLVEFFNENEDVKDEFLRVLKEDGSFFDCIGSLNESDNNFGIGLSHIRSQGVFEHYGKDIKHLLKLEEKDKDFQFADAAFIFLGILLLQNREVKNREDEISSDSAQGSVNNYNHGFILLTLIMGSLPNVHILGHFLKKQVESRCKEYSSEGTKILEQAVKDIAKNIFYLDQGALEQTIKLFEKVTKDKRLYLKVESTASGLSVTYNGKDNKLDVNVSVDVKDNVDISNEGSLKNRHEELGSNLNENKKK